MLVQIDALADMLRNAEQAHAEYAKTTCRVNGMEWPEFYAQYILKHAKENGYEMSIRLVCK